MLIEWGGEGVETQWKPITEPPEQSGYVLIACYHHRLPKVLEGFCKVYGDGKAIFTENTYHGQGVNITHWMPLPKHPNKKRIARTYVCPK